VGSLREEVSSVLGAATSDDEVVVKLESSGGLVHEHGLAASQLLRLREHGIPLTVVVDKIAASGGYMMACTADRIVAAPFAILGSIGVLLQLPNFNRLLDAHGIDFEQIKGGEHKRSLTLFGKNTEADRVHMREEINHTHELFKRFVAEHRPGLDLAVAATGEHWYGRRALEFGLCDTLGTSDDYLIGACESADVYLVRRRAKRTLAQRLAAAAQATFTGLGLRAWQLEHERRLSGG
jgi:serine protease SohB